MRAAIVGVQSTTPTQAATTTQRKRSENRSDLP